MVRISLLLLSFLLLSGCYDSGYNPGYVISDTAEQDADDEKARDN